MGSFTRGRSRAAIVSAVTLGLAFALAAPAAAAGPAPSTPTDLVNEDQGCSTDSNAPAYLWGREGIQVEGMSQDANTADVPFVTMQFQAWPVSDPTQITTVSDNYAEPMFEASATVPVGALAEGQTYAWRAQATGAGGASDWSATCYFAIDNTAPANPPTVGSPNYPTGQRDQGGAPIQIDLGPNGASDVAGYVFSWVQTLPVPVTAYIGDYGIPQIVDPYTVQSGGTSTASAGFVQASSVGAPTTVNLIPPQDTGLSVLTVASLDRAYNESPSTTYWIFVGQDEPSITALGPLPSFGKATQFKLAPDAGLEAASPVTGYTIETLGETGQQTTNVSASGTGTAEVSLTDDSSYGEIIIVSSVSADGWVSQAQWYFVNTTPVVKSDVYPENGSGGGVGVTGTFNFSPPVKGVASYTYSFNWGPQTTVKADGDGTAKITWTPDQSGWYDLEVYATTKDGTQLFPYDYFFTVN